MKLLLKISSEKNLLKAMGSEVKTGKYYNNAGKVAMRIHKKNTYHFDYSKGKKQGYAKHSDYSRMTHGLKHESEFQKQTKGKIKGKAGLHAEKHRTKKGHTTTKWVKNAKPGVKGTKQRTGSKVNDVKPRPKQTGKQEPVVVARPKSSGGSAAHLAKPAKPTGKKGENLGAYVQDGPFKIYVPSHMTLDDVKNEGAIESRAMAENHLKAENAAKAKKPESAISQRITELASQVKPKVRPAKGRSTTDEYGKYLAAELARMRQEAIDENGGYEVESYGYNIDPKKPSAKAGLKKFAQLLSADIPLDIKIKHLHEHHDDKELKQLALKIGARYPKNAKETDEYLDAAGAYVYHMRKGNNILAYYLQK